MTASLTPRSTAPLHRLLRLSVAALAPWLAGPAHAALAVGAAAPDFSVDAAVGGKTFRFTLSQALAKGPVVLYFYPKSFTAGCTVEAHDFSDATARFAALGASVIGLSNDDLPTQVRFSTEACRGKFPVGADAGGKVMTQYDARLMMLPVADRISYVISPQGKVLASYASMNPDGHVGAAMKAVQQWAAAHPKPAPP